MKHLRVGPLRVPVTSAWLLPLALAAFLSVLVSAAAMAALESDTVGSFPRGLWWAISLITTVGFIGPPPETFAGALLSAVLMVVGFLLLAMVSASLAALFVREEEEEPEARQRALDLEILEALRRVEARLDALAPDLEHPRDRPSAPPEA
ncbi:potassium channel family protein [Nocardioides sp. GCM10027113]|uniref:potassium channel family protein n=1 Tax=unclassified Nocardioides TaxID=2615069 RepID=UPI003623E380